MHLFITFWLKQFFFQTPFQLCTHNSETLLYRRRKEEDECTKLNKSTNLLKIVTRILWLLSTYFCTYTLLHLQYSKRETKKWVSLSFFWFFCGIYSGLTRDHTLQPKIRSLRVFLAFTLLSHSLEKTLPLHSRFKEL